jgi:hypothetical protein
MEENMKDKIAESINILGRFCGKRDVSVLTPDELKINYGLEHVDVMVLFGGSILTGGDVLAEAMKNGIAKKYVIVGGTGHTTETLRVKMHNEFPEIETNGLPEAKVFEAYLKYKYNLEPDFLECKSTNCGNNIISQDATMQHRMEAGLRKYIFQDNIIINYAVYDAEVIVRDNELEFKHDIWGMWDMERYITLLMGEIPRLSDDAEGYGPSGKNYIAHVDVPIEVRNAFMELKKEYGSFIRQANPLYSS